MGVPETRLFVSCAETWQFVFHRLSHLSLVQLSFFVAHIASGEDANLSRTGRSLKNTHQRSSGSATTEDHITAGPCFAEIIASFKEFFRFGWNDLVAGDVVDVAFVPVEGRNHCIYSLVDTDYFVNGKSGMY